MPISISHADEMLQIGCPPAYSQDFASVTALSADNVVALGRAAIERILSTGVYMDGAALERLNAMGYGNLTGFTVEGFRSADCTEEFTDDPLNAGFSRRRRDCRQSFWPNPAAILRPRNVTARVLSRIVDYAGCEIAACCLGLFENSRGGRVCVAGYYPWSFLQSLSKTMQIKAIMRWLSRDTLPAYVGSYHRMSIWVRPHEEEGVAFGLINTTLDEGHGIVVMAKTAGRTLRLFDGHAQETRIVENGEEGPYRRFELPPLGAWQMHLGIANAGAEADGLRRASTST